MTPRYEPHEIATKWQRVWEDEGAFRVPNPVPVPESIERLAAEYDVLHPLEELVDLVAELQAAQRFQFQEMPIRGLADNHPRQSLVVAQKAQCRSQLPVVQAQRIQLGKPLQMC